MKETEYVRQDTGSRLREAHVESFAVQLCAAFGYALVGTTLLIVACAPFTDDIGLGQAGVLMIPVTLISLTLIKGRARQRMALSSAVVQLGGQRHRR